MTFGDGRGVFRVIGAVGQAGADELVKTSIVGGINLFDTDNYTEGESEKILGQSLKNLNIALNLGKKESAAFRLSLLTSLSSHSSPSYLRKIS
jgi:predicted aldo/keto reductase-like oxidoreductase